VPGRRKKKAGHTSEPHWGSSVTKPRLPEKKENTGRSTRLRWISQKKKHNGQREKKGRGGEGERILASPLRVEGEWKGRGNG